MVWHTLLDACQKWGNVEFGDWAFEEAIKLDEDDSSAYSMMAHIYIYEEGT